MSEPNLEAKLAQKSLSRTPFQELDICSYQMPGCRTSSFVDSVPISQCGCSIGIRGYSCDTVFSAPSLSCQSSSLQKTMYPFSQNLPLPTYLLNLWPNVNSLQIKSIWTLRKQKPTCTHHKEEVDVKGAARDRFAVHEERAMDVCQENFWAISEKKLSLYVLLHSCKARHATQNVEVALKWQILNAKSATPFRHSKMQQSICKDIQGLEPFEKFEQCTWNSRCWDRSAVFCSPPQHVGYLNLELPNFWQQMGLSGQALYLLDLTSQPYARTGCSDQIQRHSISLVLEYQATHKKVHQFAETVVD